MATIPGRWACRPDLEDYFVAVVLALAFIPSWRRDAGGQRRRSVGRLNNNGSAAEDEAAARDCRAARRAMSMQKDPIQALVAGSEGARIWKSLTMPNRFAGVCGPQVTSGPSLPSEHRSESTKLMRFQ